ncbi:hypothetical protein SAMN02910451_01642 [Butyrivibrio hungatei]|uniref:Uncharacterized protein n=1 Tax=Butyrivibrio hungatei TaxID=185008 RepID=A0A1G5DSU0_9FIRM|nr:hypothetical protein [Butyrivibrio hungatei]MBQ4218283.1 hypothetical protein [Butyrivibrio sp.]MEE3470076.1 hypothetical protein [Butyrivibrio hungatei]SCY17853.1 hypothetical protein SAMN02910451_01642 [Butyrivibrio hungatei]
MGFWDKIFHKSAADEWKKQQAELENWSDIVYTRKDLDMNDPVQRREYIGSCLQQMEEAARELDALEFEYNDVTSHLRDMEEINALPPEQRKEIDDCARKIVEAREFQEKFDKRKSRMTDEEFERMDRLKDNAKEASEKLLEAETFQKKIKNDLKRLDSEHEAYIFREDDLNETIENSKKLTITVGVVLVVMIVFLLILQFALKLNVIYGYMMLILLAAIAITVLYVQSTNAQVELKNVKKSISRLIMLQNQVKVRYVNNTNLLDYLRMKYRVMSSSELTELYNKYLRERKEREKIEDARRLLDSNQKDLIYMLRHFRVRDPEIWIHQAEALLSHNEEVEIRHSLNVRRQSLRKRMEYNKDIVAGNAKNEVEDMARQYPEYAQEILDMVSKYEDRE